MASESLLKQLRQSFYDQNDNPNERLDKFCSQDVHRVIIDDNEFTGYKTYSFFWEKTYIKEPERSTNGAIENLNSYPTFITPHLQFKFSMMSMEDYRRLYNLMLSKNEFVVTCYNPLTNETTTNKMYFYPDDLPKFAMLGRTIFNPKASQNEKWVELLGVQEYTVEMVGTNTNFEKLTLTYNLNVPLGTSWAYGTTSTQEFAKNTRTKVGAVALIKVGETNTPMQQIDFNKTKVFQGWNTQQDGSGLAYIDGDEYYFYEDKTLFAQWR